MARKNPQAKYFDIEEFVLLSIDRVGHPFAQHPQIRTDDQERKRFESIEELWEEGFIDWEDDDDARVWFLTDRGQERAQRRQDTMRALYEEETTLFETPSRLPGETHYSYRKRTTQENPLPSELLRSIKNRKNPDDDDEGGEVISLVRMQERVEGDATIDEHWATNLNRGRLYLRGAREAPHVRGAVDALLASHSSLTAALAFGLELEEMGQGSRFVNEAADEIESLKGTLISWLSGGF